MKDAPNFNPTEIEAKWQKKWATSGIYHADIDPEKPKHYALTMLPYPSGEMHIGHWYAMTPSDARARFKRMSGYNVMFPMGFDAFGLPAENAAISHQIHPKEWTYGNIERMRAQLRSMGAMFDWRREATSSDPEYYRWSEWFFLKLYEHGLAYRKKSPVDWCPKDNTTLAREQVIGEDRRCERCGTQVIKKELVQWFFRTTNYAEELLDFAEIDWPTRVQLLQTNWIGRSEGASAIFMTEKKDTIEIFTTRPDTLWGATFMVLAPEHPLVEKITTEENLPAVQAYVANAVRQSDIQREATEKEKTGVFTGGYARNPVNGEKIPIWIADYVLMTYGTGAIMAVPAHDQRDFEFALKFGLPILPVIDRPDQLTKSYIKSGGWESGLKDALQAEGIPYIEGENALQITIPPKQVDRFIERVQESLTPSAWVAVVGTRWAFIFHDEIREWDSVASELTILSRCQDRDPSVKECRTVMEMLWGIDFFRDALYHDDYGTMINSGPLSGTPGEEAIDRTNAFLESRGVGQAAVSYRLRDWLISRQRYWGAPIPMIYCDKCGVVPVPEDQLPVLLPDDVEWLPTGESPLKLHPTWKQTTCPSCDEPAERETDTMDTFMCSSWYHLRYLSPHFSEGPFDPEEYDYWMPVDTYTGGIEHATMHLTYTRFFHKACRDMGITKGSEPMTQLRNQGIVLGEDSEKMSKSRGNVVSPDNLVKKYGADTVRSYLMFFARWDQGGPWNSSGIEGAVRWLRRVWTMFMDSHSSSDGPTDASAARVLRRKVHQTLRQVTHDLEHFEFNTVISSLMELLNEMAKGKEAGLVGSPAWEEALDIYMRMLAPVAPHIAEELWAFHKKPFSIHQQPWPDIDLEAAAEEQITLVVQINGKLRDRILVPAEISEEDAKSQALASEAVQRFIEGKPIRKVIYVPGRLVNLVI
jgi:leucyl-tRNA synthetase